MKVSIGRIVHYVLANGEHRPAIIVRVWPGEYGNNEVKDGVNLQIFVDGSNDASAGTDLAQGAFTGEERVRGVAWRTSVQFKDPQTTIARVGVEHATAELFGSWHWPEREE